MVIAYLKVILYELQIYCFYYYVYLEDLQYHFIII